MSWYLVIGTVPGHLRTDTCKSRRWQAHNANIAAQDFFNSEPDYDRCLVTCVDTRFSGPPQTYVYDRELSVPQTMAVRR